MSPSRKRPRSRSAAADNAWYVQARPYADHRRRELLRYLAAGAAEAVVLLFCVAAAFAGTIAVWAWMS